MICFFDTSFVMKLYTFERGSAEALELAGRIANDAAVSTLTDVEMASSLFRQRPPAQAAEIYSNYWRNRREGMYQELRLDDAVMLGALQLAAAGRRLKSLDTIQLATALHYGANAMAVYDGELRVAAEAMGLKVLPERS